MKLFNTLGRRIEELQPLEPGRVGVYACGPTVYQYAHIGNLRTFVFVDLLVRTLRLFDYGVRHVMNITDVGHLTDDADQGEDKMLKGAREQGASVWEIARFYTEAFFRDLKALNMERPDIVCRATDHIQEMIALIGRIEKAGYAYEAGGNLYFDVSRLPDYGKLTGQSPAELMSRLKAGARIEVDRNKKNPLDFVLWFTRSKFEHQAMTWDSPWGRGYPGWHIECSAMSMRYLGEQFDIHCGGVDLVPIHHSNEIAQSEAATGRKPWVRYWLHGEFLVLAKEKMAKSTGKFLTLGSLREQGYDPLDYRYLCLGAHYRSQLQFSLEALDGARAGRRNLVERIVRLREADEQVNPAAPGSIAGKAAESLEAFKSALADDLNMPRALAVLWDLLKDETVSPQQRLGAVGVMDRVIGLDLAAVEPQALDPKLVSEIEALVGERQQARDRKDYARADEIREELRRKGIILEDTPEGVRWRKEIF